MLIVALIIAIFASIGAIVVISTTKNSFREITFNFLIIFVSTTILYQLILQSFSAVDKSEMLFAMINIERAISPAIFTIFILAMVFFRKNDMSLEVVLILFVASKIPIIMIWTYVKRKNIVGNFCWDFVRDTIKLGFRFHIAFALNIIASQLDRLIGIGVWSKDVLGQYFVALSAVGTGFAALNVGINMILLPYLAGIAQDERRHRLRQIIRVTLIAIVVAITGGIIILPFVVPLIFGESFILAANMTVWMVLALAVTPLKAVVLEASRSLGVGRPSVEMAGVHIIVILTGWLLTGYINPKEMILFFGIANVLSTIYGAKYLLLSGDIQLDRSLLPGRVDGIFLIKHILRINREE